LSDSKYHYYLKDHQGNNRVVINQSGSVEETNHYYPFGGVFASTTNVQPYKYNGKEYDTKKGLNWYDYGARHYDATLGRFTTVDVLCDKHFEISPYAYCGNEPIGRIDPDGNDWRVQTHYNRETDKIEYQITVRAALINNSSNKKLDIKTLAGQIVEQVNTAYTISDDSFVSTMDMRLRVVDSVDDIKDNEHVFQIVDQSKLTKTSGSVVMAETYGNSLDIKIGTKAVSNMLNNDDNRTFAHELGHSGGLGHTMDVENLMTQKKAIQKLDGDYLKATQLNHSQIRTVRDNYIHNKLNRHIPNWRQKLKRRQ
uniref:RHS repeat-associated core domain-containing protein n=1 Tax=Bacteroides rodentium TaxID=691816 RepID=UPI001FCAD940